MTPTNIAVSFGSAFMRHADLMEDLSLIKWDIAITEMLVEKAHYIFDGEDRNKFR